MYLLDKKLIDNELTRDELLNIVEIKKANEDDIYKICEIIANTFNLDSQVEALYQLKMSNAIINESVKLVDSNTGDIYGILIYTDFEIGIGTPIQEYDINLYKYLKEYKHINGHSFIIDKRLRNSGIDKKMLLFNKDFLSNKYDFIWIGVDKMLKSIPYWHRLGFIDIFDTEEATFLLFPLSMRLVDDAKKMSK